MSNPPHVTTTRTTLAGRTPPSAPAFRYFGAHATWESRTTAPERFLYGPDNVTGRSEAPPWFVTFRSEGAFEIVTRGVHTTYRLIIDNRPATAAPQIESPADGGLYALHVPLAGTHEIVLEMSGLFAFGGIRGPPPARSPLELGPRILFLGDSITEPVGPDGGMDGYATLTGFRLGLADTWASGSGGTGYLANGPAGRVSFARRFSSDVLRYHPDILVLAGGHNDLGKGPPDRIAQVARHLITSCRCRVILLSPFGHGTGDRARYAPITRALRRVASQTGAQFVDVTGLLYSTIDGTHPSEAGHAAIAAYLAAAILHAPQP